MDGPDDAELLRECRLFYARVGQRPRPVPLPREGANCDGHGTGGGAAPLALAAASRRREPGAAAACLDDPQFLQRLMAARPVPGAERAAFVMSSAYENFAVLGIRRLSGGATT